MRSTVFLVLVLISLRLFSQELPRIQRDTLFTSNGYKIVDGSYLILGNGSMANGDFRYVINATKAWSLAGKPFTRKMNGKPVRVKGLRREGSRKKGYNYYILIESESIPNGEADIESALAAGEIVMNEENKTSSAEQAKSGSVADEIRKLKDLLNQGAITRDEYEAAKKKLLD